MGSEDQGLPNLPDISGHVDDLWGDLDTFPLVNLTDSQDLEQINFFETIQPDLSGTMFTQLMECDSTSVPAAHHTPPIMQTAPLNQPVEEEESTADVLARPNFEGYYRFKITFPNEDETRNGQNSSWTYSKTLDELFVDMDVDCPVQVQVCGMVPPSTVIRVSPYFRRAKDQDGVPKRCPQHNDPGDKTNRDHHARKHLIRSYMAGSDHVNCQGTKRRDLLLPCQNIHSSNLRLMTYVLRFMCRTSCAGGTNRRPFCVVFSLENNGKCLGRHVQKVHVSACPRRDRRKGEERFENNMLRQGRPIQPTSVQKLEKKPAQGTNLPNEQPPLVSDIKRACKRIANAPDRSAKQQKVYCITVQSRRVYNILVDMLPFLDAYTKTKDVSSTEEET